MVGKDYSSDAVLQSDYAVVAAQALPDDADRLQQGLVSLSFLETSRLSLEESLTKVAGSAVQAVPGADGAGVTLVERDCIEATASSAPFVADVDAIQYSIGQGPGIDAAKQGHTVVLSSVGADPRWPVFGSRVARLGVHSALSLPLLTPSGVMGVMNVYARAKHVFDDQARLAGELLAVPASIAVQNAQVLAQTRRTAEQLQSALKSRAIIERAVGIFMSRSGSDEHDALEKLRLVSQQEHRKLHTVAQSVVDKAVRRAHALHRSDDERDSY